MNQTKTTPTTKADRSIKCVQYVIAQILDGVTFDAMHDRIAFKPKSLDRFWHITFGAQIVADRIAPQTVRHELAQLIKYLDDVQDQLLREALTDDPEDLH